ncbi:MAG TPA: hypothetical protein VF134_05895 [Candidatus Dormibacteraeota bacterium]
MRLETAIAAAAAAAVGLLLLVAVWDMFAPRLRLRRLSISAPAPWLRGVRAVAFPAALIVGAWLGRTYW